MCLLELLKSRSCHHNWSLDLLLLKCDRKKKEEKNRLSLLSVRPEPVFCRNQRKIQRTLQAYLSTKGYLQALVSTPVLVWETVVNDLLSQTHFYLCIILTHDGTAL